MLIVEQNVMTVDQGPGIQSSVSQAIETGYIFGQEPNEI